MRTLKTFKEVYTPKSPDENNFVKKHIVQKTEDKNGNKDDVFNATNIKAVDREKTHHGYNANSDEKVYEAREDKCSECGKVHEGTCTNESVEVDEESMTDAQMKKREEPYLALTCPESCRDARVPSGAQTQVLHGYRQLVS